MGFNITFLILRETLEASFVLSALLAINHIIAVPKSWQLEALILGISSAFICSFNLKIITSMYGGSGQEIFNITLYVFTIIFIFATISAIKSVHRNTVLVNFLFSIMTLVLIKEGSEIITYVIGFLTISDSSITVIVGSVVGLTTGLLIGGGLYHFIVNQNNINALRLSFIVLIFASGRLISLTIQELEQADIISSSSSIWNSSNLINEQSLFGQLLFAVTGYEANPTISQAIFYVIGLCVTTALVLTTLNCYKKH